MMLYDEVSDWVSYDKKELSVYCMISFFTRTDLCPSKRELIKDLSAVLSQPKIILVVKIE